MTGVKNIICYTSVYSLCLIRYLLQNFNRVLYENVKNNVSMKMTLFVLEFKESKCTVVDKKKRDTRCYSGTYHPREMKLVPFFMAKCPL